MSIPGREPFAHWSLSHPPIVGVTNFILLLDTGAFTLTGKDMTFNVNMALAKGAFTLNGVAMTFETKLIMGSGSFLLTGFSTTGSVNFILGRGSFLWTGFDTVPTFDKAFTFKRFITECHGGKVYTTRVEKIKHT